MTSSGPVAPVDPHDFDWASQVGPAAVVRRVVDAAAVEDGATPLDEAALLGLRHGLGDSDLWLAGEDAFAWRHDGAVDLAVVHRHHGLVDGRVGDLLDPGRRGRPQGLLAVGPGGAEIPDPGQAGVAAIAASIAWTSSGESSSSDSPSRTCFT